MTKMTTIMFLVLLIGQLEWKQWCSHTHQIFFNIKELPNNLEIVNITVYLEYWNETAKRKKSYEKEKRRKGNKILSCEEHCFHCSWCIKKNTLNQTYFWEFTLTLKEVPNRMIMIALRSYGLICLSFIQFAANLNKLTAGQVLVTWWSWSQKIQF